ncbi:MAG: hypothetical protein KDN19_11880 [Verrucomicrobiae bacterium]|nr:hypothetical protein [Verrucomicrobiae bacterium]
MKTFRSPFSFHRHLAGLLPAFGMLIVSCEKNADENIEILHSPPVAENADTGTPAPATLPASGEITTSAGVPNADGKRPLTADEQAKVLDQMMNRLADRQSKGLGGGHVKLNAAWQYDGYSYLSPNPSAEIPARMVAVDITVEGHTPYFDPDDIEIVDGITGISYGSDPHLTFIKAPGEPIASPKEIPQAPHSTRMLLIYAFPKGSAKFNLFYWGQKLLGEPHEFADSGWGLPFPEKAK